MNKAVHFVDRSFNPMVAGSILARPTNRNKNLRAFSLSNDSINSDCLERMSALGSDFGRTSVLAPNVSHAAHSYRSSTIMLTIGGPTFVDPRRTLSVPVKRLQHIERLGWIAGDQRHRSLVGPSRARDGLSGSGTRLARLETTHPS